MFGSVGENRGGIRRVFFLVEVCSWPSKAIMF